MNTESQNCDSRPETAKPETTYFGLDHKAQIIEIAIIDREGKVLVNQRIKPSIPIEERAQSIHGISPTDLNDCPQWPDVEKMIKEALIGKKVVIYNSAFDIRLLRQTATAFSCLQKSQPGPTARKTPEQKRI